MVDHVLGRKLEDRPEYDALAQALAFSDSVSARHLCWALGGLLDILLEDASMVGGWILRMLALDQQS